MLRMWVLQQMQPASDLTLPINRVVNSPLTLKAFQTERAQNEHLVMQV